MPSSAQYLRGINLSGAEFGNNHIPGVLNRDYTYHEERAYLYFAAKSLPLVRLCLQWERLQPQLRGPLDPLNLDLLRANVEWAKKHGARVILEIHNFGRYRMDDSLYIIDNVYDGTVKVSGADLADFWVRMSIIFNSEPAVHAYDLMNEPHDMGTADWKQISQAALDAIRANGDTKLVMIPGLGWSSAEAWPWNHGPSGWISDPANNFAYEAHTYFDHDNSGAYVNTYDWELALNPGLPTIGSRRIQPFVNWCRANNARCYLGEFGVPGDDPRWLAVMEDCLQALDAAGLDATYWAAGEWWGDYKLSVQPRDSFNADAPQLAILLGHLPPGSFTTVSAASSSGYFFAPGSLASGYGANLTGSGGEVTVEIRDSAGALRPASLIFTSPGQINYLIPGESATGHAEVTVKNAGAEVARGVLWLESTAPSLFAANQDGNGVAAAQVVRVAPDGAQTYLPVVQFDQARSRFVPLPVEFPEPPGRLFLLLYGTGFRGAQGAATLKVGTEVLTVTYAGPQLQFAGLDQANAELPRSLAGAGEVPVVFTADGKPANRVTISFK